MTADQSVKLSPEDLMRQLSLSDTAFEFTNAFADAVPDPNGLEVKVIPIHEQISTVKTHPYEGFYSFEVLEKEK